MSRARGPQMPIVETSSVRSVSVVAPSSGSVVGEPLAVGHAVRAAGDDAEVVVAEPHHGQVGPEAALGVEHRACRSTLPTATSHWATQVRCTVVERARARDVEDAGTPIRSMTAGGLAHARGARR